jgi:hypothetical protein
MGTCTALFGSCVQGRQKPLVMMMPGAISLCYSHTLIAMQWDPINEQLAILPSGNTTVFLWTANKDVQRIDTEFKVRM